MNTRWAMAVAVIAGIALILVAAILIMEDAREDEDQDGFGQDDNGDGNGDENIDEETDEQTDDGDDNDTIEISSVDSTWPAMR